MILVRLTLFLLTSQLSITVTPFLKSTRIIRKSGGQLDMMQSNHVSNIREVSLSSTLKRTIFCLLAFGFALEIFPAAGRLEG